MCTSSSFLQFSDNTRIILPAGNCPPVRNTNSDVAIYNRLQFLGFLKNSPVSRHYEGVSYHTCIRQPHHIRFAQPTQVTERQSIEAWISQSFCNSGADIFIANHNQTVARKAYLRGCLYFEVFQVKGVCHFLHRFPCFE